MEYAGVSERKVRGRDYDRDRDGSDIIENISADREVSFNTDARGSELYTPKGRILILQGVGIQFYGGLNLITIHWRGRILIIHGVGFH